MADSKRREMEEIFEGWEPIIIRKLLDLDTLALNIIGDMAASRIKPNEYIPYLRKKFAGLVNSIIQGGGGIVAKDS
mgnify:CR=1 FL=1